jgi:hypothetical protein
MSESFLKLFVRLPIFLAMWVLFIAIKLPTAILGLVVVPLIYPYRATDYADLPFWTRPWANPEDHQGGPKSVPGASLPKWWVEENGAGLGSWWRYNAIRNPANGLRSFEFFDLDINPRKVRYWTPTYVERYEPWYQRPRNGPKTYGYWAWQGLQSGCKLVHHWNDKRHFVLKFGWRVEPRDHHEEIDPTGIRHEDAGFASKFLPYREG